MINFEFHLSERTMRALLRDPQLPANPTFEDIRAALARLEAFEDSVSSIHPGKACELYHRKETNS